VIEPLIILRHGAAAEAIASVAPPLGLLEKSRFAETAIELEPGDGFFLHTDGLYVSSGRGAVRWTPERLQALLTGEEGDAQALLDKIRRSIAPHDGRPLADDVAGLLVRRACNGEQKNFSEAKK